MIAMTQGRAPSAPVAQLPFDLIIPTNSDQDMSYGFLFANKSYRGLHMSFGEYISPG